jgi:ABC-2 type transport system ATP-binding protein
MRDVETAIELTDVTKRYGDVTALRDLYLRVREGEVYGFLGPNGAGKSTTIDLLLDFIRPTDGTVSVLGHDAGRESLAIRRRTGVLPEGVDLYDRLTGRRHLAFAAESKGASDDPAAIAERVGIPDAIDRKVGGYSKGMKQRLALGAALVGQPDLLVLDEPSTGLDPGGAREMREIVRAEADRGATVFFSSHILEQVEAVCDRVGILRNGELVTENTVEGLRDAAGTEATLTLDVERVPDGALDAVRGLPGVSAASATDTTITTQCRDDAKAAVVVELDAAGAEIHDLALDEASLEELFMSYTAGGVDSDATETGTEDGADATAEKVGAKR